MRQRIAVLEAGPMGLAAAYQLALDGQEPVVFEAGDRIGGMAAAFDSSGLAIERYYHYHCVGDVELSRLHAELDLTRKLHWVRTRMGFWYENRLQPWDNPMALLSERGQQRRRPALRRHHKKSRPTGPTCRRRQIRGIGRRLLRFANLFHRPASR